MARTLGSSPSLRPVLALLLLTGGCSLFKALTGNKDQTQTGSGGGATYTDYAAQQQAELEKQDKALQAEIETLWKEIDAEGITSARALAITDLTRRAYESGAVQRGTINGPLLGRSTLDHLGEAITAEPGAVASLELARGRVHTWLGKPDDAATAYVASLAADPQLSTFAELAALSHTPAVDTAVIGICPDMRKQVTDPALLPDFVEVCLQAAGGDSSKLKWDGIKKDLVAHRKEMEKRAEEERIRAEEERKRAEEEAVLAAAQAAKAAQYVTAAVFAAGTCSFGDCMKNGWEIRTDSGTIRVSCSFSDCLKNGWEASFPDGGSARTTCSFSDCMKNGWETRFPDGSSARTSCSFSDCAKNGWETSLPDGSSARTSCNFSECYTKGWETSLPDGGRVRCDCNFSDCLANGTSCG
jgi:hypothetical protein